MALETCNPPFIAFYGGFLDSIYKSMETLSQRFREVFEKSGWQIRYYAWTETVQGEIDLKKHWWSYSKGRTPIILIGHSFGGAAVYKIARSLPNYLPLVVTLDPAGTPGDSSSVLQSPTSDRWIHIWTLNTEENRYSRNQLIGWLGGLWGHQERANSSIPLNDVDRSLDHGEVAVMFLRAMQAILEKANCSSNVKATT